MIPWIVTVTPNDPPSAAVDTGTAAADTVAAAGLGLRTTRQRRAVVAALGHQTREFKSAQEWREIIQGQGESIGLSTVYRTLQAMATTGEVDVIVGPDGESKFRRCSAGHHHHLTCRDCGRTVEITATEVERWAQSVAAEHGYTAEHHTVEISGLCSRCP